MAAAHLSIMVSLTFWLFIPGSAYALLHACHAVLHQIYCALVVLITLLALPSLSSGYQVFEFNPSQVGTCRVIVRIQLWDSPCFNILVAYVERQWSLRTAELFI